MIRMVLTFVRAGAVLSSVVLFSAGCGDKTPPPSPSCEEECRDGVALRALRETMKQAFNTTLQGKDVGTHDETTDKFLHGSARVFGDVTSNAAQGTTELKLLTYVFSQATYYQKDTEPKENFVMAVDGTITQKGTIAVQPSSTTALIMKSEEPGITLLGKVYDPPLDYVSCPKGESCLVPTPCAVEINQNGNKVAGLLCGREAGFEF